MESINPHDASHWTYDDLSLVLQRRYLLRHVALELFAKDGRTHLIIMPTTKLRDAVYAELLRRCPQATPAALLGRGAAPSLGGMVPPWQGAAAAYRNVVKSHLRAATSAWQEGSLSSFGYLMTLNTLAGRSYNDLTQYPVFPWVVADYDSEELDLSNPASFRDLSCTMGALQPARRAEFVRRFESMSLMYDSDNDEDGLTRPFHFGTHYSSSAIVLHYLVRMQPFAAAHVELQQV